MALACALILAAPTPGPAAGAAPDTVGPGRSTAPAAPAIRQPVDPASVAETVEHRVRSDGPSLYVEERLYRAEFDPKGFRMVLRAPSPERGPPDPTDDPGPRPSPLDALAGTGRQRPFDDGDAFRIATASRSNSEWRARGNVVSRALDATMTERITALDGRLKWDVILHTPPAGDVTIAASIEGPVAAPREVGRPPALRYPLSGGRAVRVGQTVVLDASGQEVYRALPIAHERALTLHVPAQALHGARFPVTVDPTVSPEYQSADPVYVDQFASVGRPAVAWGGSSYLVVWHEPSSSGYDIRGARVTPDGTLLDPVGFDISAAPYNQWFPRVAWNGDLWLVVWSDFRRKAGYKTRPDILDDREVGAQVADTYGARVDAHGRLLDPGGIAVSTGGMQELLPDVASAGGDFMVVWQDDRPVADGDSRVHRARVAADGTVRESGGVPMPAPLLPLTAQLEPSIASNGEQYAIVWREEAIYPQPLRAARVAADGTLLDPNGIFLGSAFHRQEARIASDGDDFLIAWAEQKGPNLEYDIAASRLTAGGVVLDPQGIRLSVDTHSDHEPVVAWNGREYMVAWSGGCGGSSCIRAARVRADGTPADLPGGFQVSGGDYDLSPAAASNGDETFVVWNLNAGFVGPVYGARVRDASVSPRFTVTSEAESQDGAAVAWNGSVYLVVWRTFRNGNYDIYGARVSADGRILDGSGSPIAAGPRHEGSALTVVSDGNGFLVAWEDPAFPTISSGADVLATRVGPDGRALDSPPLAVATGDAVDFAPRVVFTGTRYLIAWARYAPGAMSWRARTVGSDGTLGNVQDNGPGVPIDLIAHDGGAAALLFHWDWVHSGACPCHNSVALVGADGDRTGETAIPDSPRPAGWAFSIASNGSGLLVVGHSGQPGTTYYWIEALRLDAAGNAIGEWFPIAPGPAEAPDAVWAGDSYVVAWTHWGNEGTDVYATRVAPDGSVIDGDGFAIAGSKDYESGPRLTVEWPGRVAVLYSRYAREAPYGGALRAVLRFVEF